VDALRGSAASAWDAKHTSHARSGGPSGSSRGGNAWLEHFWQNTRPHARQWCFLVTRLNATPHSKQDFVVRSSIQKRGLGAPQRLARRRIASSPSRTARAARETSSAMGVSRACHRIVVVPKRVVANEKK
jgi:hypothetical protein